MAHFARVIDGTVARVHVVANQVITVDGVEHESLGQQFLADLHGYSENELFQCSYNGKIRFNYPAVGFSYDAARDAFIPPQPYNSWILDEATCLWQAPIEYPSDGGSYAWDETAGDWIEITE